MKKILILLCFLPVMVFAQHRPLVDAQTLQGLDTTNFVRTTAANRVVGQGTLNQVLTTDGSGTLTWTTIAAVSGVISVDATNIEAVNLYRVNDTVVTSFAHDHPQYKLYTDHAYGTQGFSDSTTVVTCTQNVYSVITGAAGRVFNTGVYKNVTFVGDSIQIQKSGDYELHQSLSYSGSNTDTYHVAFFVNGVEASGFGETERDMSSINTGASGASTILALSAGDWITLRIKNTANNNDPTLNAGNIVIQKK